MLRVSQSKKDILSEIISRMSLDVSNVNILLFETIALNPLLIIQALSFGLSINELVVILDDVLNLENKNEIENYIKSNFPGIERLENTDELVLCISQLYIQIKQFQELNNTTIEFVSNKKYISKYIRRVLSKYNIFLKERTKRISRTINENKRKSHNFYLNNSNGLLGIQYISNNIHYTGSFICNEQPKNEYLREFFDENHYFMNDNKYYTHGYNYIVGVDKNKSNKEKFDIYLNDFISVIKIIKKIKKSKINLQNFDENDKLWYISLLDYLKNSCVTLFNSLVSGEKEGEFNFDNVNYIYLRKDLQEAANYCVELYYNTLINFNNTKINYLKLFSVASGINEFVNNGSNFSKIKFIPRGECQNPLSMLYNSYLISDFNKKNKPEDNIDIVFSMPSGGTEPGMVFKHINKIFNNGNNKLQEPELFLFPVSLHTVKEQNPNLDANQVKNIMRKMFDQRLRENNLDNVSKNIFILDDNSSTGSTISFMMEILQNSCNPNLRIVGTSVVEADLKRTSVDRYKESRSSIANDNLFKFSTSVLRVGADKFDTKEKFEKYLLTLYYKN